MEERYIKANNNQGWGVAAAVIALAIALVVGAWWVKRTTYHSPNDVLAPSSSAKATGH